MNYPVDIVIPVWNRPVETRASLASLVEHTPEARIIMVNNGSERETERILEEFAESLDERAILVSAERNIGRVAALNRGIELATAHVAIVVQEGINVTTGWLEPILRIIKERSDAGIVVPIPGGSDKRSSDVVSHPELDHGSFGFMAVRRELYSVAGGFDEDMDAGIWSLRDYTRRAHKLGYLTFSCTSSCIKLSELKEFGSTHLRKERIRQGELSYYSNWGVGGKFCIVFTGNESDFQSKTMMHLLLTAARQGCELVCITSNRLHKWLHRNSLLGAHQNLRFDGLPLFFPGRALLSRIKKIVYKNPEILIVNVVDSPDGDVSGSTLDDFIRMLEDRHTRYFSQKA